MCDLIRAGQKKARDLRLRHPSGAIFVTAPSCLTQRDTFSRRKIDTINKRRI